MLFTFNVLGAQTERKLGVTVSKKVSKRAVDRNRIKRVVKEFYRHNKADLNLAHLVITAKANSASATNVELNQSLQELWVKLMKWQRWHSHKLSKADTTRPDQTKSVREQPTESDVDTKG